jgi:pyruvate ferredoxin oxidoreductase gamma subunit
MISIRIHGRGGQGSVTAAELIAAAAFYDGKSSQAFPNFGVERRGAPVTAFVRIDDNFIRLRSQVYNPDYVIIQDPTLIGGVDVFAGLKKDGVAIINTDKDEETKGVNTMAVPAVDIAIEIIGRPIVNTILLGAFAGRSGLISLKSVEKAISEQFSKEIAAKNILAARAGFKLGKNQ